MSALQVLTGQCGATGVWGRVPPGQENAGGRDALRDAEARMARLAERLQARDASARKYKVRMTA